MIVSNSALCGICPPPRRPFLAHMRDLIPSRGVAWRARPLLHPPELIGPHHRPMPVGVTPKTPVNLIYDRHRIVPLWIRRVQQGQLPWLGRCQPCQFFMRACKLDIEGRIEFVLGLARAYCWRAASRALIAANMIESEAAVSPQGAQSRQCELHLAGLDQPRMRG